MSEMRGSSAHRNYLPDAKNERPATNSCRAIAVASRALLEHYALWRGELWPVVLAILTLAPFSWGRWWPVE